MGNIPGRHEVRELQKTAILGTGHILREVLTWKNYRTSAGTKEISAREGIDRLAATVCSLGTWFVSGI